MGKVTTSGQNNITSPNGNSLAVFVDGVTEVMKVKDVMGNIQPLSDFTGCKSPFKYNANATGIEPILGSNNATGTYATIGGGQNNTNSSAISTIIGGENNNTCNFCNTHVIGSNLCATQTDTTFTNCISVDNLLAGCFVSVGANKALINSSATPSAGSIIIIGAGTGSTERCGLSNNAQGCYSVVTGGKFNCAFGDFSTISGGICNCTYSNFDTIAGGQHNVTCANQSIIGGGSYNTTNGNDSTIAGGRCNTTIGNYSIIGGGFKNSSSASNSIVGGGSCNSATCEHSFIGGGYCNLASGIHAIVVGGKSNASSGCYSTIGGGDLNVSSSSHSTISGGSYNIASGFCTSIIGGYGNTSSGAISTVGGGSQNASIGGGSSITGGQFNNAIGEHSFVGGGFVNTAQGNCSAILGGQDNETCNFANAMIVGSNLFATQSCTTFMNCASIENLTQGCLVCVGANKVLENSNINASTVNAGLFAQITDSTIITATTVETSLISTGVGTLSVPANAFEVGDSFNGFLDGEISCLGSATIQIRVKTLLGVILLDSGLIDLSVATLKSWTLSLQFTIRALGTSGVASISSGGVFSYVRNGADNFDGYVLGTVNNTTFDTTLNNTLIITAQWNTNNASNSIFSRNFVLNKVF